MALKAHKVVVAVHGVGDQKPFETLRSVANQYSSIISKRSTITIGRLYPHSRDMQEQVAMATELKKNRVKHKLFKAPTLDTQIKHPLTSLKYFQAWKELPHLGSDYPGQETNPETNGEIAADDRNLGFAEVYWADIAREFSQGKLDSLKQWVGSLLQRMKRRCSYPNFRYRSEDGDFISDALKQHHEQTVKKTEFHVDTINNLLDVVLSIKKTLLLDKDKATCFDRVLQEFLGDVQIYAEYEPVREQIVSRFTNKMMAIWLEYSRLKSEQTAIPELEIHIVAHSLGTVVALHGMLKAIADTKDTPWLKHIRSFVTLGSPIDKFGYLWPSLFKELEKKANLNSVKRENKINWINFYDYRDPVGYELDDIRNAALYPWINKHFNFIKNKDVGFYRYNVFGVAHIDYWEDKELFKRIAEETLWPNLQGKVEKLNLDAVSGLKKVFRLSLRKIALIFGTGWLASAAWFLRQLFLNLCGINK